MREFNITGKIIPETHYYVDLRPQIKRLMTLVEKGKYFVINRPRQFGKTTLLDFFARHLQGSGKYVPALISFQLFAQRPDMTEAEFYSNVSILMAKSMNRAIGKTLHWEMPSININNRYDFFKWLGDTCLSLPGKMVLLIDEIDAVPESVVIGFLAGLREMFLQRDLEPSPHSVGLVGVHDIKNLQARYRDQSASIGSTSPFNIALDYELLPFNLQNIREYFMQHTNATGQIFDSKVFRRVHHVTNGHPWLVSMLAKIMVEEIVPKRKHKVGLNHAEEAIQRLINFRNPNFESLFNNARRPNLFPIVLDLLEGRRHRYNIQDDDINLGVRYGIFAEKGRQLILANLIYVQALYQHFERTLKRSQIRNILAANRFEDQNGHLNFRHVLDKFQAFMKAKGSHVAKQPEFKEATGQLLLLSYLDAIVNGKGWTFKEVQSGEGRIDVLCCYKNQKEVVEVKVWYGERRYGGALTQLAKYLESENLSRGYLVVFDRRENLPKEYAFKEHQVAGKKIQAWVV